MSDNDILEPILTYGLNETEAKAFKLTLLWEVLKRKVFPDYRHGRVRRSGDPRKTLLFKYCLKLAYETNGLIEDMEYKLYIRSQLEVLKGCSDGTVHALIDPRCLVGPKAWRRWMLWQGQQKRNVPTAHIEEFVVPAEKVKEALRLSAIFLSNQGVTSKETIQAKIANKEMMKWVALGKVSPFFVVISPKFQDSVSIKEMKRTFQFDPQVYLSSITPEISCWFWNRFETQATP